jgi:hypothetical protein
MDAETVYETEAAGGVPSFFMSLPCLAANTRWDGNWWQGLGEIQRVFYVVGLFDGMQLGNNFSQWCMTDAEKKSCQYAALQSFGKCMDKNAANITAGQVKDGLDKFYEDYRNRQIKVYNAAWIVFYSTTGVSQAEIDKMTESWRKNSKDD